MPARDRPSPRAHDADLGLAQSSWPAGLRWGAAAAALVGTAYALAYVTGLTPEF